MKGIEVTEKNIAMIFGRLKKLLVTRTDIVTRNVYASKFKDMLNIYRTGLEWDPVVKNNVILMSRKATNHYSLRDLNIESRNQPAERYIVVDGLNNIGHGNKIRDIIHVGETVYFTANKIFIFVKDERFGNHSYFKVWELGGKKEYIRERDKFWIVFLTHLYYKMERRLKFNLTEDGNLNLIPPIREMWKEFGPLLIAAWKHGDIVDFVSDNLLSLNYGDCSDNDLFVKVFGKKLAELYSRAVYMNLAQPKYLVRHETLYYFNNDENFQFIDSLKPYSSTGYAMTETEKSKVLAGFDKNFQKFFEKYIGSDFSKAKYFFEVYLRSKIKQNEKSFANAI
jgi:hypothetical protein